jgi:hypothetical protein
MKADYWDDPELWTPDQVREFRIGLDEMYLYARELLKG